MTLSNTERKCDTQHNDSWYTNKSVTLSIMAHILMTLSMALSDILSIMKLNILAWKY